MAQWSRNPGPIAEVTLQGLAARNVPIGDPSFLRAGIRQPQQLAEIELTHADRIIALYKREHRVLLQLYFPQWVNAVEYWHVPDLDEMNAEKALALMEWDVQRLIHLLAQEESRKEVKL